MSPSSHSSLVSVSFLYCSRRHPYSQMLPHPPRPAFLVPGMLNIGSFLTSKGNLCNQLGTSKLTNSPTNPHLWSHATLPAHQPASHSSGIAPLHTWVKSYPSHSFILHHRHKIIHSLQNSALNPFPIFSAVQSNLLEGAMVARWDRNQHSYCLGRAQVAVLKGPKSHRTDSRGMITCFLQGSPA